MNRTTKIIFATLLTLISLTTFAQHKREFRGAWIQCVNGQFQGMSAQKMQQTLRHQLNELKKDGCNAIIFQVRPECDALYQSNIEPWSRFLTGQQGVAPATPWDPLQWMITECHKRGMELHAWINPYRAKTKTTKTLAPSHIAIKHPERVFPYDGQLILNPALPENRDYICRVVRDIVTRYDIDGLHMDDYFYPYPAAGQVIPDDREFKLYNNGIRNKNDWRRYNVNLFVQQMNEEIHRIKPWVKFGISPFGIYRNKKSDPRNGSETNGLQNYDDLYADILLWIDKGWVDYTIPQVYWEIGHKAADYETLVGWWAEHAGGRPLYIGQDVMRTIKAADAANPTQHQQARKMELQRSYGSIGGSCQWPASAVADNANGYATALTEEYHRWLALQPEYPFIDDKAPKHVKRLSVIWTEDGPVLCWTAPKYKEEMDRPTKYVVYRFIKGEDINLDDATKILGFTTNTFLPLTYEGGQVKYTYVVTALDRLHNESKPKKEKIKL